MSARRPFLERVFAELEARRLPWCVTRNFASVFADENSDVDLLARPADVPAALAACLAAAAATGWRLVQRARFVNHSWVFWDGGAHFIRIDVDTSIRWRCWPVLTAAEVLAARQPHGGFFIPSAPHEGRIIRTQLAWLGVPSERYAQRLRGLGERVPTATRARRDIVAEALRHPARILAAGLEDVRRLAHRMVAPPGAVLHLCATRSVDPARLLGAFAVLFPPAKGALNGSRRVQQRCLFRGGLALTIAPTPDASGLASLARQASGSLHWAGERAFVGIVEPSGRTTLAHPASGALATLPEAGSIVPFVAETLARELALVQAPRRGGACVALAGLDGAGKTTFARELCAVFAPSGRFRRLHYFHWIPTARVDLPWPDAREQPRKAPLRRTAGAAIASGARLLKNVLLAQFAWHWRVRPLVRRGGLVILDRFLFNYWLDPASVRYAGPAHWLEWARRFLPRPDLLITLEADADTLLARKRELNREQIAAQIERLRALPPLAAQRLPLDARRPSAELVREALEKIAGFETR